MTSVEHLVVLMLENRSFDCMLGWLYRDRPDFDGLTGHESNPWHRDDGTVEPVPVWNDGGWNDGSLSPETATMPNPDPGESFKDIAMQIHGLHPDGTPRMNGFVDNFMRQKATRPAPRPEQIMHCFAPEQLPVLSTLARCFGVSDRWFASAPCETWPNRQFAHTGQSGGHVNNAAIPRPFFLRTVFRQLEQHGRSWKVYFHDMPQTAALAELWSRVPRHFRYFDPEFLADAAGGTLPHYSFVEPRYFPAPWRGDPPNDAHPPHNVACAEQLVADLYNAVRASPAWERTLLVIVFDEHGGCYDHVAPPPATPAGRPARNGFAFDRFGPRVPAVIVSPFVPAGSVIRPPPGQPPFDHTSLIATLGAMFDLNPPLSPRVAVAPHLLTALSLERPDNHGPDRLDVDGPCPPGQETRASRRHGLNNHQLRLLWPGALLAALGAKAAAHTHRIRRARRA